MKRMVFRSVAKLTDGDPVEIFWLAGFCRTENNEWKVRTVYRNKRTGDLMPVLEPIGMLPMLNLGICFDHGVLKTDHLPGEWMDTIVPNVGEPEVITSADLPPSLYAFPEGKAGNQRLLRYRTATGDLFIPAIELIRALFVHNRALALALMRTAGLEQLIAPLEPGPRNLAKLKFTKEMPQGVIGHDLAMNVAWVALDPDARRAWDSVRRLSDGQSYVLLEPPPIRNSLWTFRGIQQGRQWLVLELRYIGGREAPFKTLEYTHPTFRKSVRVGDGQKNGLGTRDSSNEGRKLPPPTKEYDVEEGGSASCRGAQVVKLARPKAAFKNNVTVIKLQKETERKVEAGGRERPKLAGRQSTPVQQVTAGERAGKAKLPPLEFKTIVLNPATRMGDLEALDETIRHMRDLLPDVQFSMGLLELERGRAIASVGSGARVAMVVTIHAPKKPLIALIDMERSGIASLSLMSIHFSGEASMEQVEIAVQKTVDGWTGNGGSWSAAVENELAEKFECKCLRLPKSLVPREHFAKFSKEWAGRLVQRLGLA
jgi:hypothetical protein